MACDGTSRRLPICLSPDITTECWNYYRMAIVNAYPGYDSYMINQFNHLYMDTYREIHYGFSMYKSNPFQSYAAVIDTYTKPLSELYNKNDFIEFTNDCIKNGMYPLFECDYNVLMNNSQNELYLHEILVYGIENEYYISPCLINGHWTECKLPIQLVSDAFFRRKNLSHEEETEYLWKREYLAPYTILKPKQQPNITIHPYEFYHDICHILQRTCIENRLFHCIQEYGKEFSGVLAVYNGVLEILNEILDGSFDIFTNKYPFELTLKRLHEYACLFRKHIYLFERLYNIDISKEVYNNWEELLSYTEQAYLLAIKYRIKKNNGDILSISDCIYKSFKIHHTSLEMLEESIRGQLII